MSPAGLFGFVTAQVAVFQFASLRLSQTMPSFLIGAHGVPAPICARVDAYRRGLGRGRRILGAGLIVFGFLAAFALPLEPGPRKLLLAAASLISSTVFAIGYFRDYAHVKRIAAELPASAIRAASLERRALRDYYPPALEALPVAIWLATIWFTLRAASETAAASAASGAAAPAGLSPASWILPALQLVLMAILTLVMIHQTRSVPCLSPLAKSYQGDPEEAVRLDQLLRALKIRSLMLVKTGVVALVALIQLEHVFPWPGSTPPAWIPASQWVVTVLILALFAGLAVRVSRLRKLLHEPASPSPAGGTSRPGS
jgi:hypothetical protein